MRVSNSERARADMAHQYRWYADHARTEVAERFLLSFNTTAQQLAQHPFLGRPRRFRAAELRGMRSLSMKDGFEVHLIFYRLDEDVLFVERVMHGARDLPRRLKE